MESPENYNFSIFQPRNLHGRKNRNVIFTMLLIWAIAVFGFQILLKAIEKPTPEKALVKFESLWPSVSSGQATDADKRELLNSLLLARGKNTLKADEQKVIANAITSITYQLLPESQGAELRTLVAESGNLRSELPAAKGDEYLGLKARISALSGRITGIAGNFTGITTGSLEASIFSITLQTEFPLSLSDPSFEPLDDVMRLYMTHNRSVLTDSKFLGFPFHYFYTAFFLLILFVVLCIVYNIMVEWRLNKEGVVE
jgi:putative solute:sodium symporter small subunit